MNSASLALVITLMIQALVSLAALTAPVLAPVVAPDIGFPVTKVGIFVAIVYLAGMVSSLCSGDFIMRYGAIRVSQVSLAFCAIGLGLATFGTPITLVLGALFIGGGYGPITPASSHVLARSTPAHMMSFVFSLKQTGVPLGGALAGIVLPPLVAWGSWGGAAAIVATSCLLMIVVAQPIRREFDGGREISHRFAWVAIGRPIGLVMRNPRIRELAICTTFFSVMQLCLTTYLVTFLTTAHGLPLAVTGLILFVAQAGGVAGRLAWGALADRCGAPDKVLAFLALSMGACAIFLGLVPAGWPLWAITLLCGVFGATAIGWNGVYLAEVARHSPPGQVGLYTGGTLVFTYAGVVAGPPVFAVIVERLESFSVAYGLLGIVIIMVATWLTHSARRKPRLA